MKKLIITVDTNDADYNTKISTIDDKELALLIPIFNAIKGFKPYKSKSESGRDWTHNNNWPCGEYGLREDLGEKPPQEIYKDVLTEADVEFFHAYLPALGDTGYHDITSIEVLEVSNEQKYL